MSRKFTKTNFAGGTAAGIEKISTQNTIIRTTMAEAIAAGYEDPAAFCRTLLDIDPYEAQENVLRGVRNAVEGNFVAGNRVGKSWIGGAWLVWKAFYQHISPLTRPDRITPHNTYKAVSTSLTIDQAKLAWTYALTFMQESARFKPFLDDVIYSPFPTITINTRNERGDKSKSQIWARSLAKSGVYLLGHSINAILVDECAYIKKYPTIEDEVIRMRLADTGGSIFRISTPNGKNHFYTYYLFGVTPPKNKPAGTYFSYRIATWDNPYVSRAFLEEQKSRMIPEFYQQNVMGEFVSLTDFFKTESITALYDDIDYPVFGDDDFDSYERPNAKYVMGTDLGAMHDPTVVFVMDISTNPWEVVHVSTIQNGSWRAAREHSNEVYRRYRPVAALVDATGAGAPVAEQMIQEDGLPYTPFVFTASSKPDLMVRLQDAVQRRRMVLPYVRSTRSLIDQMSFYRLDDKALTQDHVIAFALANMAAEQHTKGFGTEIADHLMGIPVMSSGRRVPTDMIQEDVGRWDGGLAFTTDPRTGMYVPIDNDWTDDVPPFISGEFSSY